MEKIIEIGSKKVPFKCTGGFLLRYKEITGRDPIKDIFDLSKVLQKKESILFDDLRPIYDILYVLAKTADPNIPDIYDWLDSFEEFPVVDIMDEIMPLISASFSSKLMPNAKKKMIAKT